VKGGREGRDLDAVQLAKAVEAMGAGEIMLNCIDNDGKGQVGGRGAIDNDGKGQVGGWGAIDNDGKGQVGGWGAIGDQCAAS
jgi:hypothetical protein